MALKLCEMPSVCFNERGTMIYFHRTGVVQMTGCPVFLLQASKNLNAKHIQNIKKKR